RASYHTPWSRSMFAGELAKPSSISLGAFDPETHELLGYLIISRYVDAWHVMNLAVAPKHRRRHIAAGLLERLFVVTAGEGRRGPARLHARGARLERHRDPALRAGRLQGPRRPPRLLHRQPRGRADHVARPRADATLHVIVPLPPANAVAFVDVRHGWVGGAGGLLGTNDGRTFRVQSRTPIIGISAVDRARAWATTGTGFVLRTSDGRHWSTLGAPHLFRIQFVDARVGFGLTRDGVLVVSGNAG